MYVRTYLRTYVRTYIRTYVHTYIRTYVRTYVHTYIRTYIYIYGMMIYCTVFTCITSYCIGYYYVMLLVHLGLLKTLHLRLGGFGADADVQQHGLRGPPRCVFRSKLSSRWLQNIGRALLIFEGYLWNTVKLQLIWNGFIWWRSHFLELFAKKLRAFDWQKSLWKRSKFQHQKST
jgi:hypothetical protein